MLHSQHTIYKLIIWKLVQNFIVQLCTTHTTFHHVGLCLLQVLYLKVEHHILKICCLFNWICEQLVYLVIAKFEVVCCCSMYQAGKYQMLLVAIPLVSSGSRWPSMPSYLSCYEVAVGVNLSPNNSLSKIWSPAIILCLCSMKCYDRRSLRFAAAFVKRREIWKK